MLAPRDSPRLFHPCGVSIGARRSLSPPAFLIRCRCPYAFAIHLGTTLDSVAIRASFQPDGLENRWGETPSSPLQCPGGKSESSPVIHHRVLDAKGPSPEGVTDVAAGACPREFSAVPATSPAPPAFTRVLNGMKRCLAWDLPSWWNGRAIRRGKTMMGEAEIFGAEREVMIARFAPDGL